MANSEKKRISAVAKRLRALLKVHGLKVSKTKSEEVGDLKSYPEYRGRWIKIAKLGKGQPGLELFLDNALEKQTLRFWFGFQCSRTKDQLTKLTRKLSPKFPIVEYVDTEAREGFLEKLSAKGKKRRALAFERMEGPGTDHSHYFGLYQLDRQSDARFAAEGAALIIALVRSEFEHTSRKKPKERGSKNKKTTAKRLALARIGQDAFRLDLMSDHRACFATNCSTADALVASHIMPWAKHEKLRLQRENGLLLIANLDALFDNYLISFRPNGKIAISDVIPRKDRKLLNLKTGVQIQPHLLSKKRKKYLALHYKEFLERQTYW